MHSLLESYLSKVAAHLRPMPAKQRTEELREMRTHLEAAVAAQRELGQSEEDAVQNAVMQFGTPDALGRSAVAAWRRGVRRDWRDLAGAAACTFALMLATHLIMLWCSAVHSDVFRAALQGGGTGAAISVSNQYFPRRAVLGIGVGVALFFAAFFGVFHLGLLGLGEAVSIFMGALVGTRLGMRLKSKIARKRRALD